MKRKKISSLRQTYQRERKRLQGWQRRAEKRGFIFDKSIVPTIPKRVTQKALEKIKQLRPKQLYEKAKYIKKDTGEIFKGEEARKVQQQELRERKSKIDEIPLEEYPQANYVETLVELINALPDIRYFKEGKLDIHPYKTAMISNLYDTMGSYDNIADYDEYISNNFETLQEQLRIIEYYSKQEVVNSAYSKALTIIVKRDLTPLEATQMAEVSELYGGY